MTSRERLLAALRCEEVDYVPMTIGFWPSPLHPKAAYGNERERLAWFRARGLDAYVTISGPITPLPEVRTEVAYESGDDGSRLLRQTWHTPAATLTERLKVTDDWAAAQDVSAPVWFHSDFRTSRYREFAFKDTSDLLALDYLFPLDNPADDAALLRSHAEAQALAEEFEAPLAAVHGAGMDWLTWLYPVEEAVLRVVDQPETMRRLLSHINAAHQRRLERLLDLGVDVVIRRGWYESADFWSPAIYRDFARPAVETEIKTTHAAAAAYVYIMDTGIMPLLAELAAMPFECLLGADPATSDQDLGRIRRSLGGKALWGGISGPLHLGRGTPADVERAVERAFAACGKEGFILGPAVGFRHDWPWENFEACERAWRRLRN